MHILIAPTAFKGSLTPTQAADAILAGLRRSGLDATYDRLPLADGGDGTLESFLATGGRRVEVETVDALMHRIHAPIALFDDGTAVVEMALASGLALIAPGERDALRATSDGTGLLMRAALDARARRVIVGLGGSATTDGGAGILGELGADFADWPVVRLDGLDPRLAEVELRVACDVTNPLLGEHGAAATYGPQKGADPEQVRQLDASLRDWADALEWATGRQERDTPGAGAAGGTGFGLLAIQDRFRSFALRPGVDLVLEATGAADAIRDADVVLTGEGRIDAQTAFGKTALGVARRAREAGRACIALGGGITVEGIEALAAVGAVAVPTAEGPATLEDLIAAGRAPLERAAERIARLISIGTGGA